MFPRIPLGLHFGGVELALPTYGLMVATGFVLALVLAERLGRRAGYAAHVVQDVIVFGSLWGLVGAKLALVALEPHDLVHEPWRLLFEGGVFYGGLIAAFAAAVWRCRTRGLDIHALADVCAAPLALGHAFGRVGCFLAGCCWGRACEMPWAVTYTDPGSVPLQSGWPPGLAVHPVQLYESAGNLVLMGLALVLLGRRRFAGQAWWTYVIAYAVFRFVTEMFRGDVRGSVLGLSTSQAVAVGAVVLAAAMLAWCRVRPHGRELIRPENGGRSMRAGDLSAPSGATGDGPTLPAVEGPRP